MIYSPYQLVGAKLCERGYSAIPIIPSSKIPGHIVGGEWRPLFDWGRFCDRLPTEIEISHWSSMPGCGVGLAATHGINFADIDTINRTIADVIRAIIPHSPAIKTGQKGETLFYRADFPARHFDINGERVLDWLGHGTQTVLPPSLHERTGKPYTWIGLEHLQDLSPGDLPLVTTDNMAELVEALEKLGYHESAPRVQIDDESDSPWRRLNNEALANLEAWVPHLGLARCKRVRNGYRAVASWRPSHTGRPLEQRGLNLKIDCKGIKDFHDADRGYTALDLIDAALCLNGDIQRAFVHLSDWLGHGPSNVVYIDKQVDVVDGNIVDHDTGEIMEAAPEKSDKDFPDADLMLPGYLGEVTEWILATSRHPVRLYAATAAISFVGTLMARRVYCSAPLLGTHLYMLLIGGTGAGKDRPQACVRRLLNELGLGKSHINQVASTAALGMQLHETPAMIQIIDEIDQMLRRMSHKYASSHEADLQQAYQTLWSTSVDEYTPTRTTMRTADAILRPSLSILGATTPTRLYEHLRGAMVSGGFLNRFLVLPRHTRVPRNRDVLSDKSVPESILATGKKLIGFADIKPDTANGKHWITPTQNAKMPAEPHEILFAPGAMPLLEHIMDEQERRNLESDKDMSLESWVRYADMTQRIALIVACGRCADDGLRGCIIDEPDLAFAEKFVRWSIDGFVHGLQENMAENEHQANSKLVLKHIRRHGNLKRRDLMQWLGGRIEARQLDGIIRQLADAEQIAELKTATTAKGGRPGVIYSAK